MFSKQEDDISTTVKPPDVIPTGHDYKFLIVPLVVIVLILLLAALIYLMLRRKRRMDLLRQNLLVMYDFDSAEREWGESSHNSEDSKNRSYGSTTTVF